jgi:RimJ/RimL family protein N-acetyltransferase
MTELTTPRLRLRHWQPGDQAPLAALHADPLAMQFLPRTLTADESRDFAAGAERALAARGFGLWALELTGSGEFLGCAGLNEPSFAAHFVPCMEVLWRLLPRHWGHGYATEAARACIDFAFGELGRDEVVAFTVPANARSRAVMERLGMRHASAEDFDHPRLPPGDPLRRHVLYRLRRAPRTSPAS